MVECICGHQYREHDPVTGECQAEDCDCTVWTPDEFEYEGDEE